MWLMVMFDLPVTEAAQRKASTAFRNGLLDLGFEMAQFSVYVRFCAGQSRLRTYQNRVRELLPEGGKVKMIAFTDKQYGEIVSFEGSERSASARPPPQLALF